MTAATDIRKARAFLQGRGIRSGDVSPRAFVAAAAEHPSKSWTELLNFLLRALSGGQGGGPAPAVTKNVDRTDPKTAIGEEEPAYAEGAR